MKRVDFGLPRGALGPGEVEAFLTKGLLRTDMAGWHSGLSSGGKKSWDAWRLAIAYRECDGRAVSQHGGENKARLSECR